MRAPEADMSAIAPCSRRPPASISTGMRERQRGAAVTSKTLAPFFGAALRAGFRAVRFGVGRFAVLRGAMPFVGSARGPRRLNRSLCAGVGDILRCPEEDTDVARAGRPAPVAPQPALARRGPLRGAAPAAARGAGRDRAVRAG